MNIKIDVISGFLGAGKTTLIKKLLAGKQPTEKIAIIENEFGEVGIDASLLKQNAIEIKELNLGCICCSLQGDFVNALQEVVDRYKPDRIIIEPSGVAKLSDVRSAVNRFMEKNDSVVLNIELVVVDAIKYPLYAGNFGEFFMNQVSNAQTIVLSRIENLAQSALDAISADIRKHNKQATIISLPLAEISAEEILLLAEKESPGNGSGCTCSHEGDQHNHHAHQVFENWSLETQHRVCKEVVDTLSEELQKEEQYGFVIRGKGILPQEDGDWIQFDYTPKELAVRKTEAISIGKISITGCNLNRDNLKALFHKLT